MPDELQRLLVDCQDFLNAWKMHQFLLELAVEQCHTPSKEATVRAHILIQSYCSMMDLPISDLEDAVLKFKAHYQDGSHPPANLPPC